MEHVGLAQESLPSNVVSSAQVLASVANLLNIRDTELSRFAFAVCTLILYAYVCDVCDSEFNVNVLTWRKHISFLVAMADLSLRKTSVEEKKSQVQQESKVLLDYTRKAISRLTYLKR